jgi:hypothetical protein
MGGIIERKLGPRPRNVDSRLLCQVADTKFVEHVRVQAGQIGNHEVGVEDIRDNPIADHARVGILIRPPHDPMRKMMRQIVGAVVEAEKARLVGKLKAARDRKSAELGYTVNSSYHKRQPGVFDALRFMRQQGDMTLETMAEHLEAQGFVTRTGKRLAPTQVARLMTELG